jgi:two-component system response regulator PilR (NtrC family)
MMLSSKKDVKILVVDDDRQLADVLADYLTKLGYRAIAAYGGREGFEMFKRDDFQLVITDLMMPDMDGMEFMEAVKRLDSRVIVMVVTGFGTIESAVSAIKKGAYDFIPKPFKMEELEVIIMRALERHSMIKQLGMFRGLTLALLISIPLWLILGIILALIWR